MSYERTSTRPVLSLEQREARSAIVRAAKLAGDDVAAAAVDVPAGRIAVWRAQDARQAKRDASASKKLKADLEALRRARPRV